MQTADRSEVESCTHHSHMSSSLGLRSLRPLATLRRLSPFVTSSVYKAPQASIGIGTLQRFGTMSDISKYKSEPDGSFKRPASSFRNFIKAGGQFPPEKGTSSRLLSNYRQ